jgi:cytochrome c
MSRRVGLAAPLLLALAAGCGGSASRQPAPTAACTATTAEPGFELLFDGTEASAAQWRMAGPGRFRLEDCTLRTEGGLGLLWHPEPLSAYTLRVDWRVEGDDNSGVFVGFPDPGDDPWVAVRRGHEIQIDATDDAGWTTGGVYGALAPDEAARDAALRPPGEWNTFEITVSGDRVTVALNGTPVADLTDTDPARLVAPGHVGLQNHGDGDDVSFRSVRVRRH